MTLRPPRCPDEPQWGATYEQLKVLARGILSGERANHTLQPTALVHEVFLRFRRDARLTDADGTAILANAARAMRDVLVEHARHRGALKRGGASRRAVFDAAFLAYEDRAIDLLSLHEALEELARVDAQLAQLVELRFFGGLTEEDAARVLAVSTRTVRRGWRVARQWLWRRLQEDRDDVELAARPARR